MQNKNQRKKKRSSSFGLAFNTPRVTDCARLELRSGRLGRGAQCASELVERLVDPGNAIRVRLVGKETNSGDAVGLADELEIDLTDSPRVHEASECNLRTASKSKLPAKWSKR